LEYGPDSSKLEGMEHDRELEYYSKNEPIDIYVSKKAKQYSIIPTLENDKIVITSNLINEKYQLIN
jgi:2-phosphoglycerate kinase